MSAPEHAERAHALLSASGAVRWLACTPSARLEDEIEDVSSEAAKEGTFAHELAEVELRKALGERARRPRGYADSPYYAPEMEGYLTEYVTAVMERVSAHRAVSPDALILIEDRLDFGLWVPEGFGTGDVVIVSDLAIEVIDLKYGKGVRVDAQGNPQLRLYGLAALHAYDQFFDADQVIMTIVQPRLDHISSETMEASELFRWADEFVVPRARLAFEGRGEFAPGEHCRFCKIAPSCKARAEQNLKLAKYEFAEPATLTIEEIADILGRVDELVKWANDVKGYALEQVRDHGAEIPGWKLVEGRSNRKYADEDQAAAALIEAGYEPDQIYKPKALNTITAIEKLMGKKRFLEVLGDAVIKPQGQPTLVPETDKRPAISSAQSAADDFA